MRSVKGRRNADGSRCRSILMYSCILFLGVSSPLKFCYRSPLVDDVPRARLARTREAAQRRPSVFDEVKRKDLTVFYLFLHITCRCRRPPPVHTQGHTLERVYASPPSAVRRVSLSIVPASIHTVNATITLSLFSFWSRSDSRLLSLLLRPLLPHVVSSLALGICPLACSRCCCSCCSRRSGIELRLMLAVQCNFVDDALPHTSCPCWETKGVH